MNRLTSAQQSKDMRFHLKHHQGQFAGEQAIVYFEIYQLVVVI